MHCDLKQVSYVMLGCENAGEHFFMQA